MYKLLASLTISLLLATYAFANPIDESILEPCGNNPTAEQVIAMEKNFAANKVNGTDKHDGSLARNIEIHWHVISRDRTAQGGNIPDQQIRNQMGVLNRDYAPMGITWTLASIDRTVNTQWYNNVYRSNADFQMRRALRRGGAAQLNVYSVGTAYYDGANRVGYSSFPAEYRNSPVNDGIALQFGTVPGGTFPRYNQGRSLSHEAGHWVGLYHTFQGACSYPNDGVNDTPAQRSFTTGCPSFRDTCQGPNFPGYDLVRNHMDYSDDYCKSIPEGFTRGQIARASEQLRTFRGI